MQYAKERLLRQEIYMYNVYDVMNEVDDLFDCMDDSFKKVYYPMTHFPSGRVYMDKDGNLILDFALAGYKKEDFKISYDEDSLILSTVDGFKQFELPEGSKMISPSNGIKSASFKYSYYVPSSKFNQKETSASMTDGILSIKVPPTVKKEAIEVSIS